MLNDDIDSLVELMRAGPTTIVAGAGMSTDAGLPDYRGSGSAGTPTVDFDLFMSAPKWRAWGWQRNHESWRSVAALDPTPAHRAVATLEKAGYVKMVATQNVDGLDARAGIENVALLHGTFDEVQCLQCDSLFPREEVHRWMAQRNPGFTQDPNPANAAILATADEEAADKCTFDPAPCPKCAGILKPAVVFFGESLPGEQLERAFAAAATSSLILVVGTSLVVGTGMWVVGQGLNAGADLAVINRGPTQADQWAQWRSETGASEVLTAVADQLLGEWR
ncbi:MAG: Sir2 family NAD-dependent protein deacetylase [Actinomycetaceae bacterium]|nr:Sir2 family NAD-dependent protein deacetylase [Actinomycetaceae bacterium]